MTARSFPKITNEVYLTRLCCHFLKLHLTIKVVFDVKLSRLIVEFIGDLCVNSRVF